jgi:hypothetical protein
LACCFGTSLDVKGDHSHARRNLPPNQNLTAGDGSSNYQAGRDVNVHLHASADRVPLIQRPTDEQIRIFAPKLAELILSILVGLEHKSRISRSSFVRLIFMALFVVVVLLVFVRYWIWRIISLYNQATESLIESVSQPPPSASPRDSQIQKFDPRIDEVIRSAETERHASIHFRASILGFVIGMVVLVGLLLWYFFGR